MSGWRAKGRSERLRRRAAVVREAIRVLGWIDLPCCFQSPLSVCLLTGQSTHEFYLRPFLSLCVSLSLVSCSLLRTTVLAHHLAVERRYTTLYRPPPPETGLDSCGKIIPLDNTAACVPQHGCRFGLRGGGFIPHMNNQRGGFSLACSLWLFFLRIWSRFRSSFLSAFGGSGTGHCAAMLGLILTVAVCLAAG